MSRNDTIFGDKLTRPRLPAEWEPHEWVWIGYPHDEAEWPGALDEARADVARFANAVQDAGEKVRLVVRDARNADDATKRVASAVDIRIHRFGDIWLRDTGPIVVTESGRREARLFHFNGWGGKFEMAGDRQIGGALAREAGLAERPSDFVFEGGAIDGDGTGLAVTTTQCLLNPNRNGKVTADRIQEKLRAALGIDRLLWLRDGLVNDHTDGHVDNLARFVRPGLLAMPKATSDDDPNADLYEDAHDRARQFGIDVADIPSPGRVEMDGEIIPASYMNFYIANRAVIVPIYGRPNDDSAVETIGALFPDRKAVGLPASGIIKGGGSFHCCSQQMPTLRA